jgi:hypothetical protein
MDPLDVYREHTAHIEDFRREEIALNAANQAALRETLAEDRALNNVNASRMRDLVVEQNRLFERIAVALEALVKRGE